jgi:hypothetical protein
MSWLRRLFGSSPSRPASRTFRLGLEALDDRLVPSVTFSVSADTHTVTVSGDNGSNRIAIRNDGNGNLIIVGDGVTRTFTGVDHLLVGTGNGADFVTYDQGSSTQSADTKRSFDLHVLFGTPSGQDPRNKFIATVFGNVGFWDGAMHPRQLELDVLGGSGTDNVYYHLNDMDVRTGSSFSIGADLFEGNDSVDIDMDGEVDGTMDIEAEGYEGSDFLTIDLLLDSGSSGSVTAHEAGDEGNDSLELAIRQATGAHADVDAIIDGGLELFTSEHDVGRHTSNVQTRWLEQDILIQ